MSTEQNQPKLSDSGAQRTSTIPEVPEKKESFKLNINNSLDLISGAFILAGVAYPLTQIGKLPAQIPMQFNWKGEPVWKSSKYLTLLFPALGGVVLATRRFKEESNLKVLKMMNVKEENIEKGKGILTTFNRAVGTLTNGLLLALGICLIKAHNAEPKQIRKWFGSLIGGFSVIVLGGGTFLWNKLRKLR